MIISLDKFFISHMNNIT